MKSLINLQNNYMLYTKIPYKLQYLKIIWKLIKYLVSTSRTSTATPPPHSKLLFCDGTEIPPAVFTLISSNKHRNNITS